MPGSGYENDDTSDLLHVLLSVKLSLRFCFRPGTQEEARPFLELLQATPLQNIIYCITSNCKSSFLFADSSKPLPPLFTMLVSILFLAGTTFSSTLPNTLVLHEKRAFEPVTTQWTRRSLAPRDAILPVRIALTQRNPQDGHNHLMDISNPLSSILENTGHRNKLMNFSLQVQHYQCGERMVVFLGN